MAKLIQDSRKFTLNLTEEEQREMFGNIKREMHVLSPAETRVVSRVFDDGNRASVRVNTSLQVALFEEEEAEK